MRSIYGRPPRHVLQIQYRIATALQDLEEKYLTCLEKVGRLVRDIRVQTEFSTVKEAIAYISITFITKSGNFFFKRWVSERLWDVQASESCK